ncbi:MAG: hypothetical protein ACI4TE_03920 [Alphaproteobacteria bacterium]
MFRDEKIILFTALMLLNACASVEPFSYYAEPKQYKKEDLSVKVVVPPYQDTRLKENKNNAACLFGLMVLPVIVPYCSVAEFNRPEYNRFSVQLVKVNEEFAKATAEEIENASVFKSSVFSFNKNDDDLVLIGNVKEMFYEDVSTYYGLTVYGGAVLGLFGAPLDYIYRTLEIEYKLVTPSYDVFLKSNIRQKVKRI